VFVVIVFILVIYYDAIIQHYILTITIKMLKRFTNMLIYIDSK